MDLLYIIAVFGAMYVRRLAGLAIASWWWGEPERRP